MRTIIRVSARALWLPATLAPLLAWFLLDYLGWCRSLHGEWGYSGLVVISTYFLLIVLGILVITFDFNVVDQQYSRFYLVLNLLLALLFALLILYGRLVGFKVSPNDADYVKLAMYIYYTEYTLCCGLGILYPSCFYRLEVLLMKKLGWGPEGEAVERAIRGAHGWMLGGFLALVIPAFVFLAAKV
jgi:uncharacterized membrane protein